ncbi:hypothetical protein DTO164E3_1352 [Paecilomyces variotii]|nr:hypothetical protein DTO032I3_4476 [Paecilomyces variotii]KAJ9205374.1 hypothetical protein DTO164E3_1352 [Paecilomyces variotii]KAJ9280494.1 hypothetical protein DTO021D3_2714 [Paecilomyces variotii]KAJ9346869.1 hypothetical protein DTO027B6_436 [Paecilomyces variotii]KAJ9354553.1 hypothetical protein DTO027B9_4589 [Paecilomyces variotii]
MDSKIKEEMDVDTVAPADLVSVQVPRTPQKRGRKRGSETAPDTPTPVKKAKATIPTSYEEAGREDRLLLQMKDKENKTWSEIREAWFGLTGVQVGGSTLPIRYARLKANFITFTPDDCAKLFEAKKEVDDKLEQERWRMIAEGLETKTGKKFPVGAVQKKFKELVKKGNSAIVAKEEDDEA